MSWIVVDPRNATRDGTKVARVEVPYFPDEIDYEKLLGQAFAGEEFKEWRETVGTIILATPEGYIRLESIMGSDTVDVTEKSVVEELVKLGLERQSVVLKWVTDH